MQYKPERKYQLANEVKAYDNVNPKHYNSHLSGIETIRLTESETFSLGNAIKYLMRHQQKGKPVEDLRKAEWYLVNALRNNEDMTIYAANSNLVHLWDQWIAAEEEDFFSSVGEDIFLVLVMLQNYNIEHALRRLKDHLKELDK